jgi:hypothetical protein
MRRFPLRYPFSLLSNNLQCLNAEKLLSSRLSQSYNLIRGNIRVLQNIQTKCRENAWGKSDICSFVAHLIR